MVEGLIGIVMCHPAIIEGAVHACCRVRVSVFCGFFFLQVTLPPFVQGQYRRRFLLRGYVDLADEHHLEIHL